MRDYTSDMSVPCYGVQEVSQMLGLPPQTIRYFDEQGIVSPKRNPSNGRRMYSMYDVYQLSLRKEFQNIGFSMTETEQIFHSLSLSEIREKLGEKEQMLTRDLRLANLRILGLQDLRHRIERIHDFKGKIFFESRPGIHIYRHIEKGKVYQQ